MSTFSALEDKKKTFRKLLGHEVVVWLQGQPMQVGGVVDRCEEHRVFLKMGGTFDGGRHPTDVWVWFDDVRALGDYGVPPVVK